jgi:hypothetical protein
MIHNFLWVLIVTFFLLGCLPNSSMDNALLGVWQIQKIETKTLNGSSVNSDPQPSLAIFTESHYSLVWMPGATGMRAFKQRWMPTDEEKIQRYGEIVVNAGTYTLSGSTLTAHPVVSRVPAFMGGGKMLYEYPVEGDTLWLTTLDEYSYDGKQSPWAAAGTRTTLTLNRAEVEGLN